MRFWDSSALVPLLVLEQATPVIRALHAEDPEIVTWWATAVECTSALVRREREGELSAEDLESVLARLDVLASGWHEVQAVDPVSRAARRLLRVHPLRTADALQLAAAVVASEGDPSTLELVTLDDRLAAAARREGFPVLPR